jgi:hypothetical protein
VLQQAEHRVFNGLVDAEVLRLPALGQVVRAEEDVPEREEAGEVLFIVIIVLFGVPREMSLGIHHDQLSLFHALNQ